MCKQIYEGERAQAFLALFEKDETLQKIAKLVYVDGLTYEKVGMIVGYSERQIGRLRKKIKQIASESEVTE
jgi:DNA-directed RNA polymerase specialized sigma subunit